MRTAAGGIRNARRAFLTVAAMALVAAGVACGVEVSRQNYEATEKSTDSLRFFIAGTQTRTANAVTVEGPYRVIVRMTTPDAEAGTLSARKLRVTRGGEVVFEREDVATDGANPRLIEVSLGDALKWSEHDTIVATVEVMRPGAPSYEKLEKTFRATREHASYSFCQRIYMH